MIEPHHNPCNKNRVTHEERRLQINKPDEWQTHVKEKPKAHDQSKRHHDKRRDETKQFKVRDKVLLDEKDSRIATSELITNGVTPFTVLNVFPYDTVEVHHSEFDTFKNTMMKKRGKKASVPTSKKQKGPGATFSSTSTEAHHPRLQFSSGQQDDLFQLLQFFAIIEHTYSELTLEFCTTFHLQHVMNTHDEAGTITF
ncbi:hypothetical protein GOBAR_AA33504 [Gossypium barbadense]|uniref:Uncharacterized protein n=1 Tax=Gossypium barbadense TaxID=3634 RepID=A0A2P5W7W6_GOSBA|nr:hypothetical protein GOBAR_AA33504 [Gossypium barbadense]